MEIFFQQKLKGRAESLMSIGATETIKVPRVIYLSENEVS